MFTKMSNQKNPKNNPETFWSGYSLGILSGGLLMYAFGTKKGRDTLKKMLSHSETIEENLNQIIDLIQNNIIDKKK
jgi:hypothetical protein